MCKLSIIVVVVAMACCSVAGPLSHSVAGFGSSFASTFGPSFGPSFGPAFGPSFGLKPFSTNIFSGFDKLTHGVSGISSSSLSSLGGSGGNHHSMIMTSYQESGKDPVVTIAKDIDGKFTYYSNKD